MNKSACLSAESGTSAPAACLRHVEKAEARKYGNISLTLLTVRANPRELMKGRWQQMTLASGLGRASDQGAGIGLGMGLGRTCD